MLSEENKQFFQNLVSAPSPSGFEGPAQKVVMDFLIPYADEINKDRNGNVIALKKGSGKLKVMVVGHSDEIGFIVNHIDEQGYVYVRTLGGFDVNLLSWFESRYLSSRQTGKRHYRQKTYPYATRNGRTS